MVPQTKNSVNEEIITVIQIFRHGSRNPLIAFKNKLYENEETRPEQLGKLTQKGKLEMYQLGKYTRNRYTNLLDPHYSKENVKIYSTTSERTIMSAQLFAAGLLPPTGEDLWHDTIQWQPIPVYLTGPYMLVSNPSQHGNGVYRKKFRGAVTEYFKNNVKEDVRAFISKNVGVDITTLDHMTGIYDSYQVGKDLGVALPDWLSKVYIDHLWEYNCAYLKCFIHTDEMKKMYIGPLFHEMITHLENNIKDASKGPKLLAFCAHDVNLTSVLDTLDIPFVTWPMCAASLFFELRRRGEDYFVKIYYKADVGDEAVPLNLRGRSVDCEFDHFKDAAMKFAYSKENVMRDSILCQND